MDPALLINPAFWTDPEPVSADGLPVAVAGLAGHVLFETSGSSGSAKQVAISKQALLISAVAVNGRLQVTADSAWGLALPPHHVGGFGVLARAFEAACHLKVFRQRWGARAFHEWLDRSDVTHTSLVPAQVHDLVKARLTAPTCLAAVVVGGGPLGAVTGQAARDLGWPVLASFGMTEAGSQIATQGLEQLEAPYQSAPIPLLPIWNARVAADDLLEISGPALFSGYVSGGKFIPRAGDWHLTSDRVALANGSLVPLGRADTLVKILGELVDPFQVERELIESGLLAEGSFAVIPVPDARAGFILVPVFEESVDRAVIAAAMDIYNARAPGFRRLSPAAVIAELPRGGLGKIRRAELAAIYQI